MARRWPQGLQRLEDRLDWAETACHHRIMALPFAWCRESRPLVAAVHAFSFVAVQCLEVGVAAALGAFSEHRLGDRPRVGAGQSHRLSRDLPFVLRLFALPGALLVECRLHTAQALALEALAAVVAVGLAVAVYL